MSDAVSNDVTAIQPKTPQFGLTKSFLIDLEAEMLTRAKQDFPKEKWH
jgi:hypothetical protein